MKTSSKVLLLAIAILAFVPTLAMAVTEGDFSAVAIGTGYATIFTPPTNGMIVQGTVGIGTSSPTGALETDSTEGGPNLITFRDTTSSKTASLTFSTPLGSGPDLNINSDRVIISNYLLTHFIQAPTGFTVDTSGTAFTIQSSHSITFQTDNLNTQVFTAGYNAHTVIRPYSSSYNVQIAPSGGNVGIGTTSPLVSLDLTQKTDALALPVGTTGQRPSGTNGDIRYNSTANAVEAFVNGLWTTFGTGATTSTVINSGGRLKANGAGTGLTYCPYKGNLKTTANYGVYTIPSACLTATLSSMYIGGTASQAAAASTLYYVYLINVSGTTYLDLETTGHATDSTTGIEIMSGNNTRTLVGMIHTDTNTKVWNNGQNVTAGDTNTVATWDNRAPTTTRCGFTQLRSLNTSTETEINSENRCYFMSWGDSATFTSDILGYPETANAYWNSEILLDGSSSLIVSFAFLQSYNGTGANTTLMVAPSSYTPGEGYHYTTLYGAAPAGTVAWGAINTGASAIGYIFVSSAQ